MGLPSHFDFQDYLTEPGAQALAAQIEAYWQAEGYRKIQTTVECSKNSNGAQMIATWCVRSNMVGGYPPE